MDLLAIILDDGPVEWRLFPWTVYFPTVTIAVSWLLIRWKKQLVLVALAIATCGGFTIINELYAEIHFRREMKAQLEENLKLWIQMKSDDPSYEHREAMIQVRRAEIQMFDRRPYLGLPAFPPHMIAAVWFVALFPFLMIAVFYFAAPKPTKTTA